MKACKDCNHYSANPLDPSQCMAPGNMEVRKPDYVNGNGKQILRYRWQTAQRCRESESPTNCGPVAQWFEPKRTTPQPAEASTEIGQ